MATYTSRTGDKFIVSDNGHHRKVSSDASGTPGLDWFLQGRKDGADKVHTSHVWLRELELLIGGDCFKAYKLGYKTGKRNYS